MNQELKDYITNVESNEIVNCKLYITASKCCTTELELKNDSNIRKFINYLDLNKVKYQYVDTVIGSFSLNRVWIETDTIECVTSFSGVYPIYWDEDFIDLMISLEDEGDIRVMVSRCTEDRHLVSFKTLV